MCDKAVTERLFPSLSLCTTIFPVFITVIQYLFIFIPSALTSTSLDAIMVGQVVLVGGWVWSLPALQILIQGRPGDRH